MPNPAISPAQANVSADNASREELSVRVETLSFELELSHKVQARLEAELRRLQQHAAAVEADRSSLRNRLDERERYLAAIHHSSAWRVVQWARGLVGRRW